MNKDQFIQALQNNSISEMQVMPKSELHSHAGRGGAISYIEKWANVKINPPSSPFSSLSEMNQWLNDNIKCHCPSGIDGYLLRVEATFAQAFAPKTDFFPDLALGYSSDMLDQLDEVFSTKWFHAIDIVNYAHTYSIKELKEICKKARSYGLVLKAHVGEFGDSDEVMRYAEELELDEIQHGIAAAKSPQIMRWLANHKIKLNVCPTSNIMLKSCESYQTHPIRILYDYGIPVTINTDDLIIFNSTLSEEYLRLFQSGLMSAEELYDICQTGLCHNYTR